LCYVFERKFGYESNTNRLQRQRTRYYQEDQCRFRMAFNKIISGGQTGADIGGVAAGLQAGLETGGTMPPNFLTEVGSKPDWAEKYKMKAHPTQSTNIGYGYRVRTEQNVKDSDGTIRFASHRKSRGEICTFNAIKKHEKPYIDVDFNDPMSHNDVVAWIKANSIEVLNVAGNRESTCRGIGGFVTDYLLEVIKILNDSQRSTD